MDDLKRIHHLEPKLMSNVKPKLSESDPRQPHATNDVSVSKVNVNLDDLKREDLEPKLVSKVKPTLSESDPLGANVCLQKESPEIFYCWQKRINIV